MELWFISAVAGAVLAGLSNFYFKYIATNGYNAELFVLYSGAVSTILMILVLFLYPQSVTGYGWMTILVFVAGAVASLTGICKRVWQLCYPLLHLCFYNKLQP
jgi:hypothetical protein